MEMAISGFSICEKYMRDMAAAGEFAGVIWIDVQAPLNTIKVPWASLNANGGYLPLVRH